jgi:phenylalanyl-tRNA synthetase alpha subunit
LGRRPPTKRYPYGYRRAEDLSGVLIALVIAISAALIIIESINALINPRELANLGWVLAAGLVGAAGNETKQLLEQRLEERREALESERLGALATDAIDITLPGRPVRMGRYHPTTIIVREITDIFRGMGFQVVEGPEVEWDRYNFEALNIPKDHPARDMWDTLWVDANRDPEGAHPTGPGQGFTMLLRTHTSPMQASIM